MKRIGLLILTVALIIVLVPLLILKGVGPGVKINGVDPGGIINFSAEDKQSDLIFNDGGPKIKVYITEKKEMSEMFLEEYIRGVVAGEMPVEFDIEALKAQAVAARTYAVTKMKAFGGKGCLNYPESDICTDSGHCQEWISKEERFKGWNIVDAPKYWDKITAAVNDTKGLILTYNAAPVMYPMFFSTSSGKTENSQDVFSSEQPYLKSVVSPYEESAPKYTSKVILSKDEFIKKFKESKYKIVLDKSKITSQVKITSRTEGGSVKIIKVGSKTLAGTEVREVLALNSANFNIEFTNNDVTISVSGYGHGVGMSQYGANGMAKNGKKFNEILEYYYMGTAISKMEDIIKSK